DGRSRRAGSAMTWSTPRVPERPRRRSRSWKAGCALVTRWTTSCFRSSGAAEDHEAPRGGVRPPASLCAEHEGVLAFVQSRGFAVAGRARPRESAARARQDGGAVGLTPFAGAV